MLAAVGETHHRVTESWMGADVETLADLLRPGLRAVCIGINPAPTSVRAGHYYQGTLGQKFFSRLRAAGVLSPGRGGWQDDEAFSDGIGFTDIVKRATGNASDVRSEEFAHGRPLLEEKLEHHRPGLALFTFKKAAEKLFGPFAGNGFVPGLQLAHTDVFIMPGPYEAAATVTIRLDELRSYLATTK